MKNKLHLVLLISLVSLVVSATGLFGDEKSRLNNISLERFILRDSFQKVAGAVSADEYTFSNQSGVELTFFTKLTSSAEKEKRIKTLASRTAHALQEMRDLFNEMPVDVKLKVGGEGIFKNKIGTLQFEASDYIGNPGGVQKTQLEKLLNQFEALRKTLLDSI